ncbi:hypothetical protein M8C21_030571, partial [Ambrosia artemisiifolia]
MLVQREGFQILCIMEEWIQKMDTKRARKMMMAFVYVIPLDEGSVTGRDGEISALTKKKAVHKTTTTDDKKLQSTLKRIGVNLIPAIEEVNIFKDDVVIQFLNP